MSDRITFLGTRGSSSLTAAQYMEFGGSTTCIILNIGNTPIMVDCGSGFNNVTNEFKDVDEINLFLTHSHIDHICSVPNLLSVFGDKKIHIWGRTFNGITVRGAIGRLMNQSLWPVRADMYKNVEFHELPDVCKIGNISVTNMDSNHPGGCSLFRFETEDDCVVTAFDFCHLNGFEKKLLDFAKGCRTLIYDGCLSEDELKLKPDWGHSTPEEGARIGKKLGCEVYITHYGIYDDTVLSGWERKARSIYPLTVFSRSGKKQDDLKKLVGIGTMLYDEKDHDTLLTKIIETEMDITGADGGTLYLIENDQLEFKVLINRSKQTRFIKKEDSKTIPAVAISGKNVCAAAAREKKLINIEDCYNDKNYDFSGAKKYDSMNNYRTQSVLVIPLMDEYGDVIGVIQLINAMDAFGKIVPFNKNDENMLMAIANQACMAIVNSTYSQKITDLLYGFVKVMSVGIDERTPYNANHTRNMVKFAERFFDYEGRIGGKYEVELKKRREILISIWLHDVGKILTPIEIMNKETRLGELLVPLNNRFERRELLLKLYKAQGSISEAEYTCLENIRKAQLDEINMINRVGFLTDDLKAELNEMSEETYIELDGTVRPIITNEEYYQLSIVKGTLNKEERSIMEGHVSMTGKLLSQLQFPKYYDMIPVYADNHHEMLDGSGYPNHLTAKDLAWPCRLITILDIFEALTAKDRPYKKPFSVEKSFAILNEMADQGKLDIDVINAFKESNAWEGIVTPIENQ